MVFDPTEANQVAGALIMVSGSSSTSEITLPTVTTTPANCAYISEYLAWGPEDGTAWTIGDANLDTSVAGKLKYGPAYDTAKIGHVLIKQTFKAYDESATAMTAPKYDHKITLSVAECEGGLTDIA